MKDEYSTKNLQIAAFLYSCKLQFAGTKRINSEIYFSFTPKDKAEELVNNYFQDKALCNPRDLFARLHDLKDLIFSSNSI